MRFECSQNGRSRLGKRTSVDPRVYPQICFGKLAEGCVNQLNHRNYIKRLIGSAVLAGLMFASSLALAPSAASAATTAVTVIGGQAVAGTTVPFGINFFVDAGTPLNELPAAIEVRVVPVASSTGSMTIPTASPGPALQECAQETDGWVCEWVSATPGGNSSISVDLAASADASGPFDVVVGQVSSDAAYTELARQTVTVLPFTVPTTSGTLELSTSSAVVGEPIAAVLRAWINPLVEGSYLPSRVVLSWTGGTGTAVPTVGTPEALTNCAATASSVECDWPTASAEGYAALPITLAFSEPSVWSIHASYFDGSGGAYPLGVPSQVAVTALVTAPPAVSPSEAAGKLAESGSDFDSTAFAIVAVGALASGALLLTSARRRPTIDRRTAS